MKYIGSLALVIMMAGCISAEAQVINVPVMEHKMMDLTAETKPVKDPATGQKCALVKVALDRQGARFKGGVVGNVSFDTNEYLVYMKPMSRSLEISLPGYKSVKVDFEKLGVPMVESRNTYELIVDVKPFATTEEEIHLAKLMSEAESLLDQKNYYESYRRYREAAALGNVEAMFWEYILVNDKHDKGESKATAVELCKKAALAGHPKAQKDLGTRYFWGQGVPADKVEAAKWFLKSAEQGNDRGAYEIAVCYEDGNGVGKDEAQAAKWYLKSAQGGNPDGQAMIASFYLSGRGVAKDMVKGSYWATQSADNGNPLGQYLLAMIYRVGSPVYQKDMVKSAEWLRKAAAQNYLNAIEALINGIDRGIYTPADSKELMRLNDQKVKIKLGD